ncbi:MAG: trypsin-like peptidase domain-containing protein [Pirellulales bacterium]
MLTQREQGTRHCLLMLAFAVLLACVRATAADETLRAREERAMQAALARVAPSVVRIETVGGLERIGRMLIGTGSTTGVVVSEDGFIVSSAFNFVQKPSSILVTLPDGSRGAARLVATDHSRMLVLLKVEAELKLTVPEAAPKDAMRVGQWALAVGRTFDADQPNVSVGIISALNRIWSKAIQTDAKVSPNNYGGALVDISGRVMGVLVPMSPDGAEEVAGVEWYDSGIGFAVPLEDVLRVLPKLEQGQDLRAGLLGVNLKGRGIYSAPVEIALARATGPAYKAGFRPGDKLVEVAGLPIERPAELKHALGPYYAGDTVRVIAERGDARIDRQVELAEKIDPYEAPFLGILPMRLADDAPADGAEVRFVYPDSPAQAAGILAGDRIRALGGQATKDAKAVAAALLPMSPDETVKVEVVRGEQTLLLEATLGRLPESLPGELPPSHGSLPPVEGERPPLGTVPVKVPEFGNACMAYVPEDYHPNVQYGVVVWLHAPGRYKPDELVELWKPLCDEHDFILLAPESSDPAAWRPPDVRIVRRMLDEVIKSYHVDPARVVVHGHEGGGALAYLFGMTNPDVVRAIAAVDAPLPRLAQPPEPDPLNRLAIYTTLATKSPLTDAVTAGIERLRALKYPLSVHEVGEQGRYLTSDELAQLVRWFDSLDRL